MMRIDLHEDFFDAGLGAATTSGLTG